MAPNYKKLFNAVKAGSVVNTTMAITFLFMSYNSTQDPEIENAILKAIKASPKEQQYSLAQSVWLNAPKNSEFSTKMLKTAYNAIENLPEDEQSRAEKWVETRKPDSMTFEDMEIQQTTHKIDQDNVKQNNTAQILQTDKKSMNFEEFNAALNTIIPT